MEAGKDLTTESVKKHLDTIQELLEEYPTIKLEESVVKTIEKKPPNDILAIRRSVAFYSEKKVLTQEIFNFLIKDSNIQQLASLLPWLEKIILDKMELLEFMDKLILSTDSKEILNKLNLLQTDYNIDSEFVIAFIELIDSKIDYLYLVDSIKEAKNPKELVKAYQTLKNENLLEQKYVEFINTDVQDKTATAFTKTKLLITLQLHELLNTKNFNACKHNENLIIFQNIIEQLASDSELLKKYFTTLVKHDAIYVRLYMDYLQEKNLLNDTYLNVLVHLSPTDLKNFSRILFFSDSFINQLPQQIISLSFFKNERLRKLANALFLLEKERTLTQVTCDLLFSNSFHPDIVFEFAQAIVVLRNNAIPHQWYVETNKSNKPLLISFAIVELFKANLLDTERVLQIEKTKAMHFFIRILKKLNRSNQLNIESFDQLIKLDSLLENLEIYKKISKLKNLSTEYFYDAFSVLISDLSNEEKLEKLNQFLLDEYYLVQRRGPSINLNESTHTSSLQQVFAEAIIKFVETYGESIHSTKLLQNFSTLSDNLESIISSHPDILKYQAAKRALQGIISNPDFVEPKSKLNLKQLLVLLWQGVIDDSRRHGALLDAQEQVIESLYEIQRGGNINAEGQDNGLADEAICCMGAVNKLLEKLLGIHPFITLQFVTPELAALKFPIIVHKEVERYLLAADPELICLKFDYLKEEGVRAIWQFIAPAVREQMLDEFRSLYAGESSDILHDDFSALLATHEDLDININLLTQIKVAYNLKQLELSTVLSESCEKILLTSSRTQRNIQPCVEKTKRYRPFISKNDKLKKLLAFLIGITSEEKHIDLLQAIYNLEVENRNQASFIPTSLQEFEEKTQNLLNEVTRFDEADFIEISNEDGKKAYLSLVKTQREKISFISIYSSDLHNQNFFHFSDAVGVRESIEICQQLLLSETPNFLLTHRYFRYTLPKLQTLTKLKENLSAHFQWIASLDVSEKSLPTQYLQKEHLSFLLVDSNPKPDIELLNHVLKHQSERVSFPLEKVSDIFSQLSEEQQINLGRLLSYYAINSNENYRVYQESFLSNALTETRKTLLKQFKTLASSGQAISEATILSTISPYLFNELIQHDFTHAQATELLNKLITSHQSAKNNLNLIRAT
ncbi:MAG: hypothetical protein AAGB33_00185, partial [Cellulomonas sp.]|nr:hypothetical protein [Rickettsiella sp.]